MTIHFVHLKKPNTLSNRPLVTIVKFIGIRHLIAINQVQWNLAYPLMGILDPRKKPKPGVQAPTKREADTPIMIHWIRFA
jgi:hypothetical protein